jgi:DNA/RNA endonuclease YhcR with UshA esterase domain
MVRRAIPAGFVLAIVIAAGCNKNSVDGTAGTVVVRAFVDADGSGAFSASDIPIAGTVTLTDASGNATQALIDGTGTATFPDVSPGSYSATVQATPPSGAVLATAPAPTVVVPFQGGNVQAAFRYVLNPGTISGQLYRDDNGNGIFDAGTDTPAAGLTVALFAGSDLTALPIATTTTDANGLFHFATLRPGTYTVQVTPSPTMQIVGSPARNVVVTAATVAQTPFRFTGSLLIPIAQARNAAAGALVAVEGIALANAGLVGTNQLYIEDATGGILAFGAPTAGINAGDDVRIVGTLSLFNGELEIVAPTGGALTVTKVTSGTVPAAKIVTVPQMNAGSFLGQLITVPGARVVSVVTTSSTAYNVNFVGNTPADTFQVRVSNTSTVPILSTFWQVGRAYDVTGIDGIFNGEHQLKPRSSADIVVGALTLTIAQARLHPANDTVNVVGTVYAGTGVYTQPNAANLTVYIEDATGGTEVFGIPANTVYVPGDSLSVRGVAALFSGEYEISKFASGPPVISKLGTGATIVAKTITPTDFSAKLYDGQFIRVEGLLVSAVSTPNASGAYNVTSTSPDGTTITIRIDQSTVGILNTFWQIGTRYDVMGVALNFVSGATTTPEVKPRSPADVALSNVNVVTIATAKLAANLNDTLTVEGIVTAARATFNVAGAYIEDATSGTQIFNLPLSLSLQVGDAVRVHGKMVVFSGENELENNIPPTDSLKVTKLGPGGILAPKVITGAQFLSRTFEGQLVTIQNVAIVTVGAAGGTGTYTVTGTAPDGSAMTIFMSGPVGAVPPPAATFLVGSHYDVTGIASVFSNAAELKPRGAADVVAH